jgi:hypothetical protein
MVRIKEVAGLPSHLLPCRIAVCVVRSRGRHSDASGQILFSLR